MHRFAIALLFASVSTAALAAPAPSCSLTGFALQFHPQDKERLPRADWPKPKGTEACAVRVSSERLVGGRSFRFTIAVIGERKGSNDIDGPVGAFLTIGRLEDEREVTLGRFMIPLDQVLDPTGPIDVQVAEAGGKVFASLLRSTPELFAISEETAERAPNGHWAGELARNLGPQDAMGRILHFDLAAMTGIVAVHQARADEPATPGSSFAPRRGLRAELEWRDGRLATKSVHVISGPDLPTTSEDADDEEQRAELRKRIGALSAGTEPCWLSAYSEDKDPKGLNVRAEPSAQARVLGQLAPPQKDADVGEVLAKEVTIIGHRKGWFLIDTKIDAEDEPAKKRRSRWFEGRGWVNARMLGARTAYSGLGEHRLFAAPTTDAHWTIGREKSGDPLTGDSPVARIHACSWDWALVETEGGQRGWRRRLCSNQLTTCS